MRLPRTLVDGPGLAPDAGPMVDAAVAVARTAGRHAVRTAGLFQTRCSIPMRRHLSMSPRSTSAARATAAVDAGVARGRVMAAAGGVLAGDNEPFPHLY